MKQPIKFFAVFLFILFIFPCQYCESETENEKQALTNFVQIYNSMSRAGRNESLNAAPYYQKALNIITPLPSDVNLADINFWIGDLPQRKQKAIRDWITQNQQPIENLRLGNKKPYFWMQYEQTSMMKIADSLALKNITYLTIALCSMAMNQANDGNFEQTFGYLLEAYRFANRFKGPLLLVDQLFVSESKSLIANSSVNILYNTKPPVELLKYFQNELEKLNTFTPPDFRGEKLYSYDFIQNLFTEDAYGDGYIDPNTYEQKNQELHLDFISQLINFDKKEYFKLKRNDTVEAINQLFKFLEEIKSYTPRQLRDKNIEYEKVIDKLKKQYPLISDLWLRILELSYVQKAKTDALITIIALLRYKNDKGFLPQKLEALVSEGYLKELADDPFSDKIFAYKKTANDFILYSLGSNLKDNGGKGSFMKVGPYGDIVFWPAR